MTNKPLVLTLGEPAGVGPEITIKAKKILKEKYPFFIVGNFDFLTKIAEQHSIQTIKINNAEETISHLDKLCIFDHWMPEKITPGHISSQNSSRIPENIRKAVSFVLNKQASAIVTNPINKSVLKRAAGFAFEGHTDFLVTLDNQVKSSVMMLASNKGFRVVPVTVHIPLKQVSKLLTSELIESTIRTLENSLRDDFRIKSPKILVTGLNPHAGENSTMGFEEIDVIIPVIQKLKKLGMNLFGPASADSAFSTRNRATYDAFVCMYHDQALIPVKTVSFDGGINITLGLSFVRTSPDHGTAIDIAGQNIASPNSLILAIKQAQKIVKARRLNASRT